MLGAKCLCPQLSEDAGLRHANDRPHLQYAWLRRGRQFSLSAQGEAGTSCIGHFPNLRRESNAQHWSAVFRDIHPVHQPAYAVYLAGSTPNVQRPTLNAQRKSTTWITDRSV